MKGKASHTLDLDAKIPELQVVTARQKFDESGLFYAQKAVIIRNVIITKMWEVSCSIMIRNLFLIELVISEA